MDRWTVNEMAQTGTEEGRVMGEGQARDRRCEAEVKEGAKEGGSYLMSG